MGQRGPKPTPTSKGEAIGSRRTRARVAAKEKAGTAEPKPDAVSVAPVPEHLPGDAAAVWLSVAPKLAKCGLLTSADLGTFERYCRAYALWQRVMTEIEQSEKVDRLDIAKAHHLDDMLRRLERSFGMNPADRADLSVAEPPKENDGKRRFFAPKLAV